MSFPDREFWHYCPACRAGSHINCDPLVFFCGCPCGTGEHLDPTSEGTPDE